MRKLGVHTSIAGGLPQSLHRAGALGCTTMQIFSHNPRSWNLTGIPEAEAALFKKTRKEIFGRSPVFIHACYLINLISGNDEVREKSVWMLGEEMRRADALGVDYVVMHTGSAGGPAAPEGKYQMAILSESIRAVLRAGNFRAGLLLENTAGSRGELTSSVKDLGAVVRQAGAAGLCFDTCHGFVSGYDIRSKGGLKELEREIRESPGPGRVKLIHLNDSKGELGSGLDRHEHLGKGRIGAEGLRTFLSHPFFRDVPAVLETPKKEETDDPMNLKAASLLMRNV
ncbi:MAG: deoxyribonuclease IV [Nitrospiraceae bacterium]|nr:deoxyribonuclease IV [Nitrospiraceae bacterium]